MMSSSFILEQCLTETAGKFLTLHLLQVCPLLLFNFAFLALVLTVRKLQSKRLCVCVLQLELSVNLLLSEVCSINVRQLGPNYHIYYAV